jgi:hypothetical protein
MQFRSLRVSLLLALVVAGGLSACATDGSFDFKQALAVVSPRYRAEIEGQKRDAEKKAKEEAEAKASSEAEASEVAAVAKMVPDAVAAQDIDKLRVYCRDGMGVSKSYPEAKTAACNAVKEMAFARVNAADCAQLQTTWESMKDPVATVGNAAENELMYVAGERLATCGRWDYVFTRLMHWGADVESAPGAQLLKRLDAKGLPIEKEFLKFIGQNPKDILGEHSEYAMTKYVQWRVAKGGPATCKEHIAVANKFSGLTMHRLMWLFVKLECRDAADVITTALADPVAVTRERACVALADLGAKKKIDKMKIVAEKDGTFKIERGVQVFWVRNTCNQAIGRLELAP